MKKFSQINASDLIISLLKADIRNNALITGLQKAGLVVEDFYLDLCIPVFHLMGFEEEDQDDELLDLYTTAIDRLCKKKSAKSFHKQSKLAYELYAELLAEKKLRSIRKNQPDITRG